MTKFFVITKKYRGPDVQQRLTDDAVEISTEPARSARSGHYCVQGLCGIVNDRETTAHGEFESLEDARAKVYELYGDDILKLRSEQFNGEDIVEKYRIGRLFNTGRSGAEACMNCCCRNCSIRNSSSHPLTPSCGGGGREEFRITREMIEDIHSLVRSMSAYIEERRRWG